MHGAFVLALRLGATFAAALVAACASVPPPSAAPAVDPYRVVAAVPLVNAGFESAERGPHGDPQGWTAAQHAGEPSYRFSLDSAVRHGGARSMRIDNIGREPFGALEQTVAATAVKGQTIRFSGWIKTRDVNGKGASLVVSAESGGAIIAHNYMTDREMTGTRDWQEIVVTLAIPAHAGSLRAGVMLQGAGTVWFDDAVLEIVSRN